MMRYGKMSLLSVALTGFAIAHFGCACFEGGRDDKKAAREACSTAYYYLQNDELAIARVKFKEARELDPHYVDAHAGLGLCEYRIAITFLHLDPENPEIGRSFERARRCFAKVMELAPRDIRGPLGLAETLVRWGHKPDEALMYADKAIDIDRKHPRARFVKGMALVQLGRLDEAIAEMVEAKRLGVRDPLFTDEVQKAIEEVKRLKETGIPEDEPHRDEPTDK